MYHSVTEWQFIDFAAFALLFYKNIIGAWCCIASLSVPVQLLQVSIQVLRKMPLPHRRLRLPLAAFCAARRKLSMSQICAYKLPYLFIFRVIGSVFWVFGSAMLASGTVDRRHKRRPTGTSSASVVIFCHVARSVPLSLFLFFEPV